MEANGSDHWEDNVAHKPFRKILSSAIFCVDSVSAIQKSPILFI